MLSIRPTAGQNFELKTYDDMKALEFDAGLFNPCIFNNQKRNMQAFVHGDNFIIKGTRSNCQWFKGALSERMQVKVEGILGPSKELGELRARTLENVITDK